MLKSTVQLIVGAVCVLASASVARAQPASSIEAGLYHTCAVIAGGGVKCWGNNSGAWAGVTPADSNLPLGVMGLTSNVTQLSAGWAHNCVRTASGGAKCWGSNSFGQLGNFSSGALVDVFGLTSGVSSVTVGSAHSCATVTGGGATCWGSNFSGQLGDGTGISSIAPVEVAGLGSGVTSIDGHLADATCAIAGSGLKCWGRNSEGKLGNGTNSNSTVPVDVSGLSSGVARVAVGIGHVCAVTSSGGVKCWGHNGSGQLGNDSIVNSNVPVNVVNLSSGVAAVAAGGAHTCALLTTGGVMCWGNNAAGQLGNNTFIEQKTPVHVFGLSSGVTSLTAGGNHTCALLSTGRAKCWGANSDGQLGDGTNTPRAVPATVVGIGPLPVLSVADASVTEGQAGTITMHFHISLSEAVAQTVTVVAQTADGLASAGSDYVAFGPTVVSFSPGATLGVVSVTVNGDTLMEGHETFSVILSQPVNAAIGDGQGVGTIFNDDLASRTFVSTTGADVNACWNQPTPCRNIAAAFAQTLTDGEVIILGSGEYDAASLLIAKGVKVTSPSGTVAFLRQGITINAPGGRVALRGLTLKGNGTDDGVTLVAASSLSVEETTFDGWAFGLNLGIGSGSLVSVTSSVFAANLAGVRTSGGTHAVSIEGTRFERNMNGLSISGGSFFVRESSFIGNSTAGVTIDAGSADIRRSEFALNGIGVNALSGATARLSRSVVFGNTTGLFAAGGSPLESSGTNVIRGNGTDTSGTITTIPEG